jgi:ATP-dependent DNA helicase RecG
MIPDETRRGKGVTVNQRPDRQRSLADHCQYLKGVGPVRAERLRALGVETVNDLLTHFPRTYYDRRNLLKISKLSNDSEVCFIGQVLSVAQRRIRGRRTMLAAAVGDDTGIVQVVWFNQPYLEKYLEPGRELVVTGELSHYRGSRQIVNPEFEVLGEALDRDLLHTGRIVPVYPATAGISQRYLRELIARTLEQYSDVVRENLPSSALDSDRVMGRLEAIQNVHFPVDWERHERARWRLKLEELFYLQLMLALQRQRASKSRRRPKIDIEFTLERRFIAALPFELTRAQKRVLSDIHSDLGDERGMHRLLQGDVGSGKTVVAAATLLAAVEAGRQGAFMVPTEILAFQHFRSLQQLFSTLPVSVGLLIGSLKPGEKRAMQARVADGEIGVVIGTHALIQEEVRFKHLAIVVIDEQHRFGVRQRAALLARNSDPHMLVMTATPIPRTLALTAYADLDLSVLDELPPDRAPVKTRIVQPDKREAMYRFIRGEVEAGRRAYLLYPVIDETEKQDLEAVVSAFDDLSRGAFQGIPMGMLHGRLPAAEKEKVMEEFSAGAIGVLVATTVIEVGVHVPEATIMVVHHPERFGLSQLHQLRGRVGRGGVEGYCFLPISEGASQPVRARLRVLTRVADGFEIAAEDLRIRGPGEFMGLRQHGVPGLKIANPVVDQAIVEKARSAVRRLIEASGQLEAPEAAPCRRFLEELEFDTAGRTIS